MTLTDGELVEASRRGELDAFGHLVARYQDVVCAVSYSSTGDRSLSEDVAQETFVAAWRQLDRVREPGRLRPWLCGIARNLGRKARRKTRREAPLEDADAHAAASASPFDELARADAERIVRDALARVPETYREVLVLYYRDNQSIRDVAETLGIGEAAVMQRLSRGRKYLADSVTALVEKSLRGARPRRDLVAAVLAAVAALATFPSRVDASPVHAKAKGSTMMKLALAGTAALAVGTTAYLAFGRSSSDETPAAKPAVPATATTPLLHYGSGPARAPALGPTAPARPTAARAKTVDDLGLLPADAEVVVGVDMARIQRSALWKQLAAPAIARQAHLRDFATECGFDPIASLASVTIGLKGMGAHGDVSGVIVVHGFAKEKATACITKLHERHGGSASIVADGDVLLFQDGSSGPHAALTFVDDTTAVLVIGRDATKDGVARVVAGNHGGRSPGYSELLHEINTDDALWLAVPDGSPMLAEINIEIGQHSPIQLHGLYGSIDVTDALVINAGARTGSPELVTKLVADVQKKLDDANATGKLDRFVDQLDVIADGGDVIVSMSTSPMKLAALAMSGHVR